MPTASLAYKSQPSDARLDVRLPSALKAHAEAVASAKGETLSEYIIEVLAERVAKELAVTRDWHLTIPEQEALLRILTRPKKRPPALLKAAEQAKKLFGSDL
jgi:uncharacterized protein (DUF1778 family)